MVNFTPVPAFSGGILIGLSRVLLLLTNGRIAGVSGVVPKLHEAWWRLAFIVGLVVAPFLYARKLAPYRRLLRVPLRSGGRFCPP